MKNWLPKVSLSKAFFPILATFVVMAGIVLGLFILIQQKINTPEIIIGMVIILGVSTLLTLLFILAVGFDSLKLTDSKQALGLPPGSVRAMIALMLIVIWVILSVFVFTGIINIDASKNADSIRLAQQLYTTMSTLVVAIAAFYFGSSSVKAAQSALAPLTTQPTIESISPVEGASARSVSITITGKHFQSPLTVKLVKNTIEATATSILSNDTTIQCTIPVPAAAQVGDKWDVVVVNNDGSSAQLKGIFTITA